MGVMPRLVPGRTSVVAVLWSVCDHMCIRTFGRPVDSSAKSAASRGATTHGRLRLPVIRTRAAAKADEVKVADLK
jgi:hypothetical protein